MTDSKLAKVTNSLIVMPAVSPDEAKKSWDAYVALKDKIAEPSDIQTVGGKPFYKKSYWRKTATFFNLTVEVIKEDRETIGNNIVYNFTCRATAPNGRFSEGTGSCDLMEKGRRNTIHNTRTTAETRAYNRAVSNLVGGGEVSAEEVTEEHYSANNTPAPVKSELKINAWQKEKLLTLKPEVLEAELVNFGSIDDMPLAYAGDLIEKFELNK